MQASSSAPKPLRRIVCILGTAALAVTLVASGFAACCLPSATRMLSERTSAFDLSPYTPDALVELACETRAFTVEDYGRADFGEEGAACLLSQKIANAAQASADASSPTAERWSRAARMLVESTPERAATLAQSDDAETAAFADALAASETASRLAALSQTYALDESAISHLDDVHAVVAAATPALAVAAAGAVCLLALAVRLGGKRTVGRMLVCAGIAVIAAFAALGLWTALDFDGFFAAFHGLFFAAGTWTFYYDSLLICMYPTAFWMGMGVIWLVTTGGLSILSCALGLRLQRARSHASR